MNWNNHPRPQMKREDFFIIKNNWTLQEEKIVMPFPPQSKLSEYEGQVGTTLEYKTEFGVPKTFEKERILLHFGAVDQVAKVWVNGMEVGSHEGGYLPFSFDITDMVDRGKINLLRVEVTDTLSQLYPYGKQSKNPGGMWYTPVSGIWQNVWLENVPAQYITDSKLKPDLEGIDIFLEGEIESFDAVVMLDENLEVTFSFEGKEGRIQLKDFLLPDGTVYEPIHWTPENPHLYEMKIVAGKDTIDSYFALRTISVEKKAGINRVCLNHQPVFMHGVLDQGYYQDGIFLPKDEEEYEKDVLRMKELGFNMLRKHIKIEPECFYYYCDKHGMLVVQDMVNNGPYSYFFDTVLPTIGFKKKKDTNNKKAEPGYTHRDRKDMFQGCMLDTLKHLFNHPCVVVYTIFNEGLGQFDSDMLYDMAKQADDTRLYDSTSGWFAQKNSDFDSEHVYFRTKDLKVKTRPLFLSECGGYTYLVKEHAYRPEKQYGYGKCEDSSALTKRITEMYEKMVLPGISKGVCGCVYTQLSDVEEEINGMYTYDREVCKVEKEPMQMLSKRIRTAIDSV